MPAPEKKNVNDPGNISPVISKPTQTSEEGTAKGDELQEEIKTGDEQQIPEKKAQTDEERLTQEKQQQAEFARKAQVLDRLFQDPNFQDWLKSQEGEAGEEESTEEISAGEQPDIPKVVNALLKRFDQLESRINAREASAELSALKADIGEVEFTKYLPAMIDLAKKHPSLAATDAYALAKSPEFMKEMKKLQRIEIDTKKKAQIEGIGSKTVSGGQKPVAKTVQEAFHQAEEELKGK
jgi:hypothetical protein